MEPITFGELILFYILARAVEVEIRHQIYRYRRYAYMKRRRAIMQRRSYFRDIIIPRPIEQRQAPLTDFVEYVEVANK